MVKYRDEKGAYSNIVLYLFLHNEEGFRRFMCMNHEQLFEQTEMIAPIVSKIDQRWGKRYSSNKELH